MLSKNEEKLKEVRDSSALILKELNGYQKLALELLENFDRDNIKDINIPIKEINKKVDAIDDLILTIFALYSPEARDLREMVAFLKITSYIHRIATNVGNYIKNISLCNIQADDNIKKIIKQSLSINRCTIKAFEYTIDIIYEIEDKDKIAELASKIEVEYSKTEDIYSIIEQDILELMKSKSNENKNYINLLKHLRKNLKIIDRLEDIVARITFARISNVR